MQHPGGRIGFQPVQWFNGGLFDDDTALPLTREDIAELAEAAALDGRKSILRSWARCSSAASIPTSAASSARIHQPRDDRAADRPGDPPAVLAEWAGVRAGIEGGADFALNQMPHENANYLPTNITQELNNVLVYKYDGNLLPRIHKEVATKRARS